MIERKNQFKMRATYQLGVVDCPKCATPIHVYNLKGLPDEFSVQCAKCGHRGFFSRHAVRLEARPERRRKPRDR